MTPELRWWTAGVVGRAHGLDGSFHVEHAEHALADGLEVRVAGTERTVERRAGTPERPLLRVSGIDTRGAAEALRGEPLLVSEATAPLEDGEWLAEELVGCEVPGIGVVQRVIPGPSCDVLEVGVDAVLVPLVSDAVTHVDLEQRTIAANLAFLGLEEPG